MLFVHIPDSKEHKADDPIIEIPPAIISRMVTYANVAIESAKGYFSGGYIALKVVKVNNKYYFAYNRNVSAFDGVKYILCIYLLKDI